MTGKLRDMLSSILKLRGDLVEVAKLDKGVSHPAVELALAGELLDMMKSPLKLVKGDRVGVVDTGVALPSTEFGVAGEVGD